MLTFAIPTWNRARYLKKCIQSIIDQVPTVDEIIKIVVFDNHSDDETPDVLREFKEKYPLLISITRNNETCDGHVNFQKCFTSTDTKWTWTMGDDDMLAKGALSMALKIIKANNYRFIHVAESTRFAGENAIYPGTLLDLAQKIGFVEISGFISCNICRTDFLKKAFSSRHMDAYNESCFSQSLALMEALSNERCAYVNMPLIELQEPEQTAETLERWKIGNTMMRYNLVAKGLKILVDEKILPPELPDEFFRYLDSNLFSKILFVFWCELNNTDQQISDERWQLLFDLVGLLNANSRDPKIQAINAYRIKLDEYAQLLNRHKEIVYEAESLLQAVTLVRYPTTYM